MAPTICSDKKRQLRAGHDSDMRRHHASAVVRGSTAAAAAAAHMTNPTSTIINYVAKGTLNNRTAATLRVRNAAVYQNASRSSGSDSDDLCRERLIADQGSSGGSGSSSSANSSTSNNTNTASHQQQISDEMVTSSTHHDNYARTSVARQQQQQQQDIRATVTNATAAAAAAYRRSASPLSSVSGSPYQYSTEEDDDTMDPADAEVHSINSAKCNGGSGGGGGGVGCDDNGGDTDDSVGRRQLLRCSLQTVFNAHAPPLSDKTALCANSKSYSNMREIRSTEGLLAIAIKTIKLVKRNQMLQRRLTQLQLETSDFIQSVLANPENRHFREKIVTKERI